MIRQRTTPILVLAILHLVGGGLGLLSSLCGCGGLLLMSSNALTSLTPTLPARPGQPPPPPSAQESMKYLNEHVPGYLAFTIISLAGSFLLDMMLLAGGIGLLKMQPWARWLSLIYAPISILYHLGTAIYQVVWVVPATEALYAGRMGMAGLSSIATISSWFSVFVSLLLIVYPITVLVILLLPSSAAAFRGELPVRDDNLLDAEEEDDDRRYEPPRSDKFRP